MYVTYAFYQENELVEALSAYHNNHLWGKSSSKTLKPIPWMQLDRFKRAVRRLEDIEQSGYSSRRLDKEDQTNESLYIEDIFIAIKTTRRYHFPRVGVLLDTWISLANESVSLAVLLYYARKWFDGASHSFTLGTIVIIMIDKTWFR